MSCKVALRRILRSIGTRALLPKESSILSFSEPRTRHIHTPASDSTTSRDAPQAPPSNRGNAPLQSRAARTHDAFVMNFLSSIEAHLDKNDTNDTPREVSNPQHTQDDGQDWWIDQEAASSSTTTPSGTTALNRKRTNVEEQGGSARHLEARGDSTGYGTSAISWADLEELQSQPDANQLRDSEEEDSFVDGSEAPELAQPSVAEIPAERVDIAATHSTTVHEQDTVPQALYHPSVEQAHPRASLAAILEADKDDKTSEGTSPLVDNTVDDQTAVADISVENTITTPQHRFPAPHPTTAVDVAQEASRRSRFDNFEIPRIPAQIMSEEYKAGEDARKTHLAEAIEKWQQFLRTRHDFDAFEQAAEWSSALSYLKAMTSKGLGAHTTQDERFSLPAGAKLRWLVDRGSAMAEIMLNTGSLFQIDNHDLETDTFEAFSFQGTPTENANARQFILGKAYFEIVREASAILCPTLEDLMSETHRAPLQNFSEPSPHHAMAVDALERLRDPSSELTAGEEGIPRVFWNSGGYKYVALLPIVRAAYSRVVLEPLELNAAVDFLTAAWPRRELNKVVKKYKNPATLVIARALARLLTTPANVAVTPSATLRTAWHWLRRTRQLPELRQILSAHDELATSGPPTKVRALGTSSYNELLCYSALQSDAHMFRYTLKCMEERSIGTDAVSWENFFVLTRRLFPDKLGAVLGEMHTFGVLGNTRTRNTVVTWRIKSFLIESLAEFPEGGELPKNYIKSFLDSVSQRLAIKKWMSPWLAKEMAAALLERGHWREAWEIAEYMPQIGRRFDSTLLTVFLRAAQGHGQLNAVMAVEIIQRFSNFLKHQRTRPANLEANLVQKPEPKSVIWNAIVYRKLLDIAVQGQCWNLTRVIWQHACCSDNASYALQKRIRGSLQVYEDMITAQHDIAISSEQFWQASWAAYAIGIGQKSSRLLDPVDKPWQGLEQRAEAARTHCHSDVAASGTLWPINSLLEDAEAALKLDLEWQKQYEELFQSDDKETSFQKWLEQVRHRLGDLSSQGILVPVEALPGMTDRNVVVLGP